MALPKRNYAQEVIEDDWLNEIAKLVAGRVSINVAGTGAYGTLTAAEYQGTALEFTGVLTGNRTVSVPADDGRWWFVLNSTSGSFTLTVKTPSGSGIVIRQGYNAVVRCNGTDVLRVSPDVTNAGVLAAVGDILDTNGNEEIRFVATGSAVNEITVTNAATGGTPSIGASGDDTNIGLAVKGKGTGALLLGQSTCVGMDLVGNQPIRDPASNEYLKFSQAASAVNELQIGNAATGGKPKISATGDDTNISVELIPKGTGGIAIGSGGQAIKKILGASTTWDPGSLADGASNQATMSVTGAALGDPVIVGLGSIGTNKMHLNAVVSSADNIHVTLENVSGGVLDIGSGTLTVLVFQI